MINETTPFKRSPDSGVVMYSVYSELNKLYLYLLIQSYRARFMEIMDLSIKLNLNVQEEELITYAERYYNVTLSAHDLYLNFTEPDIYIWAEQGSLNLRNKVIYPLAAAVTILGNIDGVIGGLEKLYSYSSKAMTYITTETLPKSSQRVISVKRSAGLPEKVYKILANVRNGKLTVEAGTEKLLKLLAQEEGDASIKDAIVNQFQESAYEIYKRPLEQLTIFPSEEMYIINEKPNRRKIPSKPPVTPILQGVEIWYDHRTKKRSFRKYIK